VGVLERLARITEQDGYLVLGAAETVVGLTEVFKPQLDRRGLYAPNPAAKGSVASFTALKAAAVAAMR
jgi:chemotaxis protein methyltransferase CheR